MKKSNKKSTNGMTDERKRLFIVIGLISTMIMITVIVMLAAGVFKKDKGNTDNDNSKKEPSSSITGSGDPLEGPLVDVEPD